MAPAINRLVLAATVGILFAGCATTASLRTAQQAEQLQETPLSGRRAVLATIAKDVVHRSADVVADTIRAH